MEKMVLLHSDEATERKVRNVASRLKISTACIGNADGDIQLEELAQGRGGSSESVDAAGAESLLLLCGLREKRLDKVLFELRREEVEVAYKAVLTPTNRTWTLRRLYLELEREKVAIARKS